MNWTFWTRTPPTEPDDCETIDPLLSLYADGMASPDESGRVEAHLLVCEACRESLAWMRATRFALASRPVVLPPADLRVRIAEAIAASSAAPVPATFGTRRAFALRPALAAAASFVMLGVVGYGLLHDPPPAAVHPVTQPQTAAPRVSQSPPVVKTMTPHGVQSHTARHSSAAPQPARLDPDRMARNQQEEAAPAPAVVKTHAPAKTDTKMLAQAPPVMAPDKVRPALDRKPARHKSAPELMATNKGVTPSVETHKALVVKPEPKHADTVVAEAPRAQTLSAPAIIEKPPVITPDPAPVVAVASSRKGLIQTAEERGIIKFHYAAARVSEHISLARADKGAVIATTMMEQNRTPGLDIAHGPLDASR